MSFNGEGTYNKRMRTEGEAMGQKVRLLLMLCNLMVNY